MRKYMFIKIALSYALLAILSGTLSAADIEIGTAAELAALSAGNEANNGYAGKSIVLTADIDLGGATWSPIGTKDHPFLGTFDGQSHGIKGFRLFEGIDGIGLFGFIGPSGRVSNVAITGGDILASGKRRIGALAGVCAGLVSNCWSMAMIRTGGTIAGGLVGELSGSGHLEDVYSSGLLLQAGDTIGGLAGFNNGGSIQRAYSTGYAKNGNGFVGADANGHYEDCYYDRKLYYQTPGAESEGLKAIDETVSMFFVLSGSKWQTSASGYPQLVSFASSDASKLSATPMYIDTESTDPINHANDLTANFRVSIADGVSWVCEEAEGANWIQIDGGAVTVVRPCTETDVLVDKCLGSEKQVVYMRPRRWEDLQITPFSNTIPTDYCFGEKQSILTILPVVSKGTPETYHYRLELHRINESGDTVPVRTIIEDYDIVQYALWLSSVPKLPTDQGGLFLLRFFAHDEGCVTDWLESPNMFRYHVTDEVDAGSIEDIDRGVQCEEEGTTVLRVQISETVPASGALPLSYQWVYTLSGSMDTTVIGEERELDYHLYMNPSTAGASYVFLRKVRQGDCGWVYSKGKVSLSYGWRRQSEETVSVCETELPYVFTGYKSDGSRESHTFTSDGESWLFSDDGTGSCPLDTLFTLRAVTAPRIQTDSEARLCQESGNITIFYETLSGEADFFHITYSPDLASYMGMPDTTGAINSPGSIVLRNVPGIGEGDNYMDIEVGSGTPGKQCMSNSCRVQFSTGLGGYVHSKYDKILFVDNNPANGELSGTKLRFTSYQWYKNGVKQEGQTGQYYHEGGATLRGTYSVQLTDSNGKHYRTCDIPMPSGKSGEPRRSALYPVPVESGGSVTVECAGGEISVYTSKGERVLQTKADERVSFPAPTTPGFYFVQIEHPDGEKETKKLIVK